MLLSTYLALQNRGGVAAMKETFQSMSSPATAAAGSTTAGQLGSAQAISSNLGRLVMSPVFVLVLYFLMIILSAAGAAYLSYTYNMYRGASAGMAFFWAILAFIFSDLYYPIYALFLNPLIGAAPSRKLNNANRNMNLAAPRF